MLSFYLSYIQLIPWGKVNLEKLMVTQLVKKFPASYGTQRFITVITIAPPTSYIVKIHFNIILSGSLDKILYALSLPCRLHTHCPFYPPTFDQLNIWPRVQIMKLLIMQFSPASFHFLCFRYIHSSQYPVLKHQVSCPSKTTLTSQELYVPVNMNNSEMKQNFACFY
jgi:hypothetical protein